MQGLNRIFLMGRLGNTPMISTSKNGNSYTALSLATHRPAAGQEEGGQKEITDWHFVRVWGKQAENCAKYLEKGQVVMVEGYLTQYLQPKDGGETEKKTGVTAVRVNFLPRAISRDEPAETVTH
jgi:single-strand DNA-binding protein